MPGTWARELGAGGLWLSLLTVVGRGAVVSGAPDWETGVRKAGWSPAGSCPSLGLSVSICQMGNLPRSCDWLGLNSVSV